MKAMEVDDDVFFADLSKQIALLIMDDDSKGEEFPVQSPPVHVQVSPFSSSPYVSSIQYTGSHMYRCKITTHTHLTPLPLLHRKQRIH